MYKFTKNFYNIFSLSRIDLSDIMYIEIAATFVYALTVAAYGTSYMTIYQTQKNTYFGPACLSASLVLIVQCYF